MSRLTNVSRLIAVEMNSEHKGMSRQNYTILAAAIFQLVNALCAAATTPCASDIPDSIINSLLIWMLLEHLHESIHSHACKTTHTLELTNDSSLSLSLSLRCCVLFS